jgi:hypothetical protein
MITMVVGGGVAAATGGAAAASDCGEITVDTVDADPA